MKQRGGAFLWMYETPDDIFIPEERTEEQSMIIDMVRQFVEKNVERAQKLSEQRALMKEAAELGLVGAHISEEYGGLDLDTHSNTFIAEALGGIGGSFDTTFAAHIGIGMLPLYFYGTEEQKQRYLVPAVQADLILSYCLTEPTSGSDALSMRTTATLSDDGSHFILNGQKMWITNAGFADAFIVFARTGERQYGAFIVDADTPGLTLGEEEHKMGIHGSSTRQVFFENVRVPKEHLLGQLGRGHKVAFNVLNIGRLKLGTMSTGGAKMVLGFSTQYAKERIQFGQPIAHFGAIREKLARMAAGIFDVESAVYRISDWLEDKKKALIADGTRREKAAQYAAMEYAIECAMMKVAGSELLDYVVDENIQIHGGIGFSEELPHARIYRDSRINRIYEGTNEINRLVVLRQMLKGAEKGENELVIQSLAWLQGKKMADINFPDDPADRTVHGMKEAFQLVLAKVLEAQMQGKVDLRQNQYVGLALADMATLILLSESMRLRVRKLLQKGKYSEGLLSAVQSILLDEHGRAFADHARKVAYHLGFQGEVSLIDDLLALEAIDLFSQYEVLVDAILQVDGYPFNA